MNLEEKIRNANVWWITPCHGPPPSQAFWRALVKIARKYGVEDRVISGNPEVNSARSQLTNLALNGGAGILFMVDADNVPTEEVFCRLVEACIDSPGIHSALYLRQSQTVVVPGAPAATAFSMGTEEGQVIDTRPGCAPFRANFCGLGCAAVHRTVFEDIGKMVPRAEWGSQEKSVDGPHFFIGEMDGAEYISDDKVLCHRARECGYTVAVHADQKVGHVKTFEIYPPEGVFKIAPNGSVTEQLEDRSTS